MYLYATRDCRSFRFVSYKIMVGIRHEGSKDIVNHSLLIRLEMSDKSIYYF